MAQPVVSLSIALLMAIVSATPGLAQTTPPPDSLDTPNSPAETPVEIPSEAPSDTLTDTPSGQEPIQVPEIVPIPPRPDDPFLPETSRGCTTPSVVRQTGEADDTYILGPGDQIAIDIFDVPELSGPAGRFTLLVDGTINPLWLEDQVVCIQGLTLRQTASYLEALYAPYILTPRITVSLAAARTLRVSVIGEVQRPGSYIVSPANEGNQILVGDAAVAGGGAPSQWPTVTQALQSAGGITQLADLRNVQIRRPFPDGSEQLISINLWELLRTGQLAQDITIRDRDTIVIPTATDISSDEAVLSGSASFAPETILVNVVGEVTTPGAVEIAPNTSLNEALLTAGGFDRQRARTSRVELIRLNPNGTAIRRTIEVDLAAGINEETNPALREGDTIVVARNNRTSVTDVIEQVAAPIGTVLGLFDIFGIFD